MILYFSGTGNTRYVAEALGELLEDEVENIGERIKKGGHQRFYSNKPYVICAPIYAWRFPAIVEGFISRADLWGSSDMYCVATCASSSGCAGKYLRKICEKKKMNWKGFSSVIMPENYIVMFKPSSAEENARVIKKAADDIRHVYEHIEGRAFLNELHAKRFTAAASSFGNTYFYGAFVSPKKFRVTDKCVGCGLCEMRCPLNNIRLIDKKPHWSDRCTHCMACINGCPAGAVEYGTKTVSRPRYFNNAKLKIYTRYY